MADADDSTGAPFGRRQLLRVGAALPVVGPVVGAGEPWSEGMALVDALVPALAVCDEEDPRYRNAAAVSLWLTDRLYGLRPSCLGDAVAKLLGVLLVGEPLRPDDAGMIVAAVEAVTADAPALHRPALLRAALDNARAAFRCGG
jgi:hypothetical protein